MPRCRGGEQSRRPEGTAARAGGDRGTRRLLGPCAAYHALAAALQDGQFVVGPMTESDLRLAIIGPADAAGLHIDPGLTDTILSDLRAAADDDAVAAVLPLLSQAMALTWEKREGDRLNNPRLRAIRRCRPRWPDHRGQGLRRHARDQQALARELRRDDRGQP